MLAMSMARAEDVYFHKRADEPRAVINVEINDTQAHARRNNESVKCVHGLEAAPKLSEFDGGHFLFIC